MTTKTKRTIGWILTALVGIFLIGPSGIPKFLNLPDMKVMMDKMGIDMAILPTIGIMELCFAVLYLIPRTSFIGAILVTAYLGGATFAHMRIGDVWIFPPIIGVIAWVALGLRHPTIFDLAFGKYPPA
jgi:hypothetical protein